METLFIKKLLLIIFSSSVLFSQVDTLNIYRTDSAIKKSKKIRVLKMTVRNSPKVTFEASLIYDYGVFELSGNHNGDFDPQDVYSGSSFGVRHGIGGILTVKIPLHKKGSLRANVSVAFNNFSSKFNKSLNKVSEYEFMRYNVYSAIVGLENNFTPAYRFKTYIGAGLIASYIMGSGRIAEFNLSHDVKILPSFRLGVSLNSGFEYMLSNKFGVNCGVRFTHANLWLKKTKASDNPFETYLNDSKENGTLPFAGFKQFAWGSFFAGFNYYIGIREKSYIYPKWPKIRI